MNINLSQLKLDELIRCENGSVAKKLICGKFFLNCTNTLGQVLSKSCVMFTDKKNLSEDTGKPQFSLPFCQSGRQFYRGSI
jgi:hypothetical protein